MKKNKLISAAMTTTILLGLATSVNAEPVYHFNGDSEFATVDVRGFAKYAYLRVDRAMSNSSVTAGITNTTKLYYYVVDNGRYQYWSGEIANSDFSGAVSGQMRLNTNTCDYNPTPYCGTVSLTWINGGTYSTQTSGVTHVDTAHYTMKRSGSSKYKTANVSGNIKGVSINVSDSSVSNLFGSARLGSNRSTVLTITNK